MNDFVRLKSDFLNSFLHYVSLTQFGGMYLLSSLVLLKKNSEFVDS